MAGELELHGALLFGLDEHLLPPTGTETLRDVDQSATFGWWDGRPSSGREESFWWTGS
ncbi:hypothetical protein [Streptomyces sp. NBC_00233]|uniref:hypothetical protein n=1 Tax=Streptomyces sp. NBC_00233 TaxID=2975686 RepID=UPI0022525372|nr:hypothetical protein [Streptomyces sp. NBC_00233]MCX5231386.1 hypothetical protein [Streptomyces sp. NBC_00233]